MALRKLAGILFGKAQAFFEGGPGSSVLPPFKKGGATQPKGIRQRFPRPGRTYNVLGFRLKRRLAKRLLILLLTALTTLGGGLFLRGKVISVPDGDTVVILDESFRHRRVRLYGVDCPESLQQGGGEAQQRTGELALFKEVRLQVIERDRYKREVALVYLPDGSLLNEILINEGQAWLYERYCALPQCAAWKAAEREARRQGLGLWAEDKPVPPWKWRRTNK